MAGPPIAAQLTRADYESLQQWRFSTTSVPVPSGGLQFEIGPAKWTLTSGSIRFMEPVAGTTTGLLFEGDGSMSMEVPDRVELEQLRRFTKDDGLPRFDISFSSIVLRSSDVPFADLVPAVSGWETDRTASERHDTWIEVSWIDPDARIVLALTDPTDSFTIASMRSERWGWIRFSWDEKQVEEIEVTRLDRKFPEVWLSLDREEDRLPDGRPGKTYRPSAALEHVEIHADLTRRGKRNLSIGKSRTKPILAEFSTTTRVVPATSGATSLHFELYPFADVKSVVDADGTELEFLRDHIGKRALFLDSDLYDSDIVVLLGRATSEGEPLELTFTYELEIANYVVGNSWYPTIASNYFENHTAELELTAPKKYEVYSMGTKVETREGPDSETTVWKVERPTPMVTFSVGDDFRTEEIELDDAPDIVAFGPVLGFGKRNMIHNVAADVANSVRFFEWLFDHPLPNETLYVTSIAAGHGQAFDGFLHMSEWTFDSEHPGASELFRAHEVAHQWWGHEVGWKTYRDQWLSESFAEYAAMMFIQSTMKDGDKHFDEILDVYTNMLNGSLRGAFSKYYRLWLLEMNDNFRGRLGPIDVGYRAGTAEIPAGYVIQSYYKGPLVIHMLRVMLLNKTSSEDLFLTILRDFIASHANGNATTEDFKRIVEKHFPGNWDWFFDQWIYGAEIPTLEYDIDTARKPNENGAYPITIHVRKTDVPADFVVPVPVQVELVSGQTATITAVVKEEDQTLTYELPARVKNVEFNARHGILAKVSRM